MIDSNVVSNTPNICWPEPREFLIHVPCRTTLDISLPCGHLVASLPLVARGADVAVLALLTIGPVVSRGVEHGGVNSWAAAAASSSSVSAVVVTLATLVAELVSVGVSVMKLVL